MAEALHSVQAMDKQDFLAVVQSAGVGGNAKDAEIVAIAVTRSLAQLVSDETRRRHFISQLPGFLKTPLRDHPPEWLVMDREALVQHVASALGVHASRATDAVRAVWKALRSAVSPGDIAAFERAIPSDIVLLLEAS